MPITPGTRLGVYEVIAQIGEGAMGQVYRARDTKLNRDVALKVLPDSFASDPDRLARFTREAQTLASLNHPNIAHIYGLEESGGVRALVMELVEGEDLSQRIAHGAISIDEALPIAKQIAEALEAAHEQGIIHRDLKPANIKLQPDGTVKVLDFGIAKALAPEPGSAAAVHLSQSPTITSPASMTGVGMILGTTAYMAPEQARGKTVGKRADIWAFGAVLYEMLTGKRAFEDEDVSMTLSKVLQREPDWALLPANVPGRIRELLRLCLEKNAKNRRSDATDVRLDLEQAIRDPAVPATVVTPPHKSREQIAWATAAVALIAVGALVAAAYRLPAPTPPVASRFLMELPPEAALTASPSAPFPAVSPDGRNIVFQALSDGAVRLWLRPIGSVGAQPMAGTEGVVNTHPFWSADSRFVGFFAGGKLKKVAIAGGPPQVLCEASGDSITGTWNQDDVIVFENNGSLHRVAAGGGVSVAIRAPDKSNDGSRYKFPSFLPDGRHFVYVAFGSEPSRSGVRLGALDSVDDKPLFVTNSRVVYAAPDHLFFVRDGTLMAQPFDVRSLSLTGDVFPVAEQVASNPNTGTAAFGVSANGTLVYRAGLATEATELTWFDRLGKNLGVVPSSGAFVNPRLSPDQNHLAVEKRDGGSSDIWQIDLLRGTTSRFSSDAGDDKYPIYSPDGKQIAFASTRAGTPGLYVRPATGVGAEELIQTVVGTDPSPTDWTPDGKVLYNFTAPETARDIWALSMTSERKASPVMNERFMEFRNSLSADGRWLVYSSNETGRFEIYVQAFPPSGGKWQVSVDGGNYAYWRRDGKEIIFDSLDGKIMAVDVKLGALLEAGVPRELFQLPRSNRGLRFAVTADAQRFLFALAPQSVERPTLTTVLNWMADIKR